MGATHDTRCNNKVAGRGRRAVFSRDFSSLGRRFESCRGANPLVTPLAGHGEQDPATRNPPPRRKDVEGGPRRGTGQPPSHIHVLRHRHPLVPQVVRDLPCG